MNANSKVQYQLVDYPARLRAEQVGQILGFEANEIPILVGSGLLKPLGKPVQNAQKFFAAQVVLGLREDVSWLEKATKAVYCYWKTRNAKKKQSSLLQFNPEEDTELAA